MSYAARISLPRVMIKIVTLLEGNVLLTTINVMKGPLLCHHCKDIIAAPRFSNSQSVMQLSRSKDTLYVVTLWLTVTKPLI